MHNFILEKSGHKIPGSLLLVILDGMGIYLGEKEGYPGNAIDRANAPTLKSLMKSAPVSALLKAHGTSVGLPSDEDMGNSEVGHNAMGAGIIYDQGAKLVSQAIQAGKFFGYKGWRTLIGSLENPGLALEQGKERAVHFIGLLSDGNVHSHINHLIAMLRKCHEVGVKKVFVHALMDGRDVEEVSAHVYVEQLEKVLRELDPAGKNYRIASGGGRMQVTMDRYEADWDIVALGWKTHVKGEGPTFSNTLEALDALRKEKPGIIDQDLPGFVISENGKSVGPIQNDDIVIFFNFRGDRAIEISKAFTEENFSKFKREPEVKVHFAGMMEYDGDLRIPPLYLVEPPQIENTVSEYLAKNGVNQFAISETQKFGHVTYFWNGNNSEKFSQQLETWVEIPSDKISFDKKPRMKADESCQALMQAMAGGEFTFLRINFANGDMVGHTGNLAAAVLAVEAVDQNLTLLLEQARKYNLTVIVTADHGNCDQMIEIDKKTGQAKKNKNGEYISKTSHTLCPVPFILTGSDAHNWKWNKETEGQKNMPGLGNIASTILTLLGYKPPKGYFPPLLVHSAASIITAIKDEDA